MVLPINMVLPTYGTYLYTWFYLHMVLPVYMIVPPVYMVLPVCMVLPIYIALLTHVPYLYQPDLLNMLNAEFCDSDEVLAETETTGGGGRWVGAGGRGEGGEGLV